MERQWQWRYTASLRQLVLVGGWWWLCCCCCCCSASDKDVSFRHTFLQGTNVHELECKSADVHFINISDPTYNEARVSLTTFPGNQCNSLHGYSSCNFSSESSSAKVLLDDLLEGESRKITCMLMKKSWYNQERSMVKYTINVPRQAVKAERDDIDEAGNALATPAYFAAVKAKRDDIDEAGNALATPAVEADRDDNDDAGSALATPAYFATVKAERDDIDDAGNALTTQAVEADGNGVTRNAHAFLIDVVISHTVVSLLIICLIWLIIISCVLRYKICKEKQKFKWESSHHAYDVDAYAISIPEERKSPNVINVGTRETRVERGDAEEALRSSPFDASMPPPPPPPRM